MTKKSVKKNYIYNLMYQIFNLLTPLITTPYVSRVLGSDGVGQYSFTYSIVSYFTLFGSLGFSLYAQREIAKNQGKTQEQSKVFWEVFLARLLSVVIVLAIYILFLLSGYIEETYSILFMILGLNIVATAFDIAFFFQGNEEFGIIILRNIIIRFISIAVIFMFVKDKTDVWVYTLSQAGALLLANISLWTRLPKKIVLIPLFSLNIRRHFKPALKLFVPTIAVSVYTMLDKTLIGVLIPGTTQIQGGIAKISDIENGYYEQSEKLVKMTMTIITSLGTVMIPRNAQAYANGDIDEFFSNIKKAMKFVAFLGIPITLGLAAVSFNITPWFFGPGYEKVPYLIVCFSPIILIIGMSNVLGLQYLIPMGRDSQYSIAITVGAIINLCLNLILIRMFWSFGACFATVFGELCITIIMFVFVRKELSFSTFIASIWKYIVSGIIMFAAVYVTQLNLTSSILHTFLLAFEGLVIYVMCLLVLKDDFIKEIIVKIKK